MRRVKRIGLMATVVAMLFIAHAAGAAITMKMGMGELVGNADKVFRGTLVSKEPGLVNGGGGTMSAIVYTFEVEEGLKGQFDGGSTYQMTVLGSMKQQPRGGSGEQRLAPAQVNPEMMVGQSYVLFATAPSRIGLSTTVGLAQGMFRIIPGPGGDATVINGAGNRGLFDGPVSYDVLKAAVRQELD